MFPNHFDYLIQNSHSHNYLRSLLILKENFSNKQLFHHLSWLLSTSPKNTQGPMQDLHRTGATCRATSTTDHHAINGLMAAPTPITVTVIPVPISTVNTVTLQGMKQRNVGNLLRFSVEIMLLQEVL